MRTIALLALLAVPCVLTSQGAVDEFGVSGYVLAPGDIPVSEGTVAYLWFSTVASTPIDSNGRFHIPGARAGMYRVTVSAPGFAPYALRVTVPPSRSLRLPPIHLLPATYFRARFVSPEGEPIVSPPIRRRSFDLSGGPVLEAPDAVAIDLDADGATRIGPLPHGITAMAVDPSMYAQARLRNVSVTGADALIEGGTVRLQEGSSLHVDVMDASGLPVANHLVALEDVAPLSAVQFEPVLTNADGRVAFERIAAGRYRVRTAAVGRCVTQQLGVARLVTLGGAGTLTTRIVAAGKATFRISSPLGPLRGVVVTAAPDDPTPPSPTLFAGRGTAPSIAAALNVTRCRGATDAEGRVTLTSFPPGPSDVAVHFSNSLHVRRLDVPVGGSEVAVSVPDGLLPVRVVSAVTRQPVRQAFISWTVDGGGRSEATATVIGEALLEAVGAGPGVLEVTAPGFQTAEEHLPEPPGIVHDVALVPLPDASLAVHIVDGSGHALPDTVVEVESVNPFSPPQIAVTDTKGMVTFTGVPEGSLRITATANGYVASTLPVGAGNRVRPTMTLFKGFRLLVDVELPARSDPFAVRVLDSTGQTVDPLLDGASDRRVAPPGHLSLGPLPSGDYVIDLRDSSGEQRQQRVRLVDRDAPVAIR